MAAVGSYLRSLQEREEIDHIDEQAAIGQVLKQVARATKSAKTVSFGSLISLTSLSFATVRKAVDFLLKSGLLEGDDDGLSLTELGYRAQFVVSS